MFFDDELTAQRNHEEHAQPSPKQRQHKNADVLKIETEEDQCRKRKDDAGSNRLAGIARRLNDIIFENRRLAERTQYTDRQDRNRDRSRDSKPGAEADIDRHRPEENAENTSQQNRANSKFRARFVGRDKGLKAFR